MYKLYFKCGFAEKNKEFENELEELIENEYWEFDTRSKEIDDRAAFKESARGLLRYFYIKYSKANKPKEQNELLNIAFIIALLVFFACLLITILSIMNGKDTGGWVMATVAMFKIALDYYEEKKEQEGV